MRLPASCFSCFGVSSRGCGTAATGGVVMGGGGCGSPESSSCFPSAAALPALAGLLSPLSSSLSASACDGTPSQGFRSPLS